ncbi:MAG TPA: hypothetical protein VI383_11765 [Gemmatimonadales bacterium]|nr:hypothetical protein [Gemmatimonadales bacterium]
MRTRFSPQIAGIATGLALISAGPASAQVVDYTNVRQYVGDDVVVEGPVARVDRGAGGTLRFAIGKTYSRRTLDVIVPAEFVNSFDRNIRSYEGKTVQVRGRILTGEAEGIIRGRGEGSSTVPAIVLEDGGRLKVVTPPDPKKPDPGAATAT